jgi:hypothetical protein
VIDMDHLGAASGDPATALGGAALLRRVAALGEYFVLGSGTGGEWLALPALLDPATVAEFVGRTRHAIATSAGCAFTEIPLRMAASSFQLGLAARLVSPVIGAAALGGAVPLLTEVSIRWQPTPRHFPRFAAAEPAWAAGTPAQCATVISSTLLSQVFHPLNDAVAAVTALSAKILWGNVASAANGAVTVLAMSQPGRVARGRAVVRALLDTEHLIGAGHFQRGAFTRRSCCLFYLAPKSGLCGDCVLAR